ncbi:MAG: PorT family protein [Bacteroidetes bacterium]|nr:MAG: PorT family protein [Bacteroidota bacterium]
MKHIIYTLSITIMLSLSAYKVQSQDRRENIEFGAKAGINLANVWDSKGEKFVADSKVGFAGGLFLGIPIGKFIGVQPELLISQKGFKGSGFIFGFPYSTTRTTTFIDVPLQVQFKPIEIVTIVAGPQFSYLITQKDEYTFGTNETQQKQEFDNEDVRNNILGFVVGADFIYGNFLLSGRFSWDVQANHKNETSSTPRYKNQLVQLTVGFKL